MAKWMNHESLSEQRRLFGSDRETSSDKNGNKEIAALRDGGVGRLG